jgi:hypothetical protein
VSKTCNGLVNNWKKAGLTYLPFVAYNTVAIKEGGTPMSDSFGKKHKDNFAFAVFLILILLLFADSKW